METAEPNANPDSARKSLEQLLQQRGLLMTELSAAKSEVEQMKSFIINGEEVETVGVIQVTKGKRTKLEGLVQPRFSKVCALFKPGISAETIAEAKEKLMLHCIFRVAEIVDLSMSRIREAINPFETLFERTVFPELEVEDTIADRLNTVERQVKSVQLWSSRNEIYENRAFLRNVLEKLRRDKELGWSELSTEPSKLISDLIVCAAGSWNKKLKDPTKFSTELEHALNEIATETPKPRDSRAPQ